MGKGNGPPWMVPDDLWGRIEPLLPVRQRRPRHPGRLPLDDRGCLQGILFVLHTGIQWEWLPQELGFGSGMTCWRRLRDWHEAGVWDRLHQVLLTELHRAGKLDWSRAVIDGSHHQARRGGPNRAEPGRPCPARLEAPRHHRRRRHPARHHSDRWQPPRHHPAAAPARRDPADPRSDRSPRHRPRQLFADRGYDFDKYRRLLWKRGIKPVIAHCL